MCARIQPAPRVVLHAQQPCWPACSATPQPTSASTPPIIDRSDLHARHHTCTACTAEHGGQLGALEERSAHSGPHMSARCHSQQRTHHEFVFDAEQRGVDERVVQVQHQRLPVQATSRSVKPLRCFCRLQDGAGPATIVMCMHQSCSASQGSESGNLPPPVAGRLRRQQRLPAALHDCAPVGQA